MLADVALPLAIQLVAQVEMKVAQVEIVVPPLLRLVAQVEVVVPSLIQPRAPVPLEVPSLLAMVVTLSHLYRTLWCLAAISPGLSHPLN